MKTFEDFNNDKLVNWGLSSSAIKTIRSILELFNIKYTEEDKTDGYDIDGKFNYDNIYRFNFTINGNRFILLLFADTSKSGHYHYDGSHCHLELFEPDLSTSEYVGHGRELMSILQRKGANMYSVMKQVNEEYNPVKGGMYWELCSEARDYIRQILNLYNIEYKENDMSDGEDWNIDDKQNNYDQVFSFDFKLNEEDISICILPGEYNDEDMDNEIIFDGSSCSVYLFDDDPNTDGEYIESGKELLGILQKYGANMYNVMSQVNEGFNFIVKVITDKIEKEVDIILDENGLHADIVRTMINDKDDLYINPELSNIEIEGLPVKIGIIFKTNKSITKRNKKRIGVTIKDKLSNLGNVSTYISKKMISVTIDITDNINQDKITDVLKNINENKITENLIYKDMNYLETFKIFEKKSRFVNFKTFNLKKSYDKLNKAFFGGKLSGVPLQWNQSKKEIGVVRWDEKSGKIDHLGISKMFKLTEEEVLSVLAHEMIHIWQIQTDKTDGHGSNFKKEMRRINKLGKFGVKVLTKQPMDHLKTTNPDLESDFGFIIIKKSKDNFEIATYDPKKTKAKNLLTIIGQNLKKNVDVEVRLTQNGLVKKYKKQSTNTTINTYKLDELSFNTLMNDSKKVMGTTLKKK